MDNVIDFINVNRERYLQELKALLAIPSISALPEHAGDVRRCAQWCAEEMTRIGMQNVRLIDTPGNPVVYGDWLGAPGAPTMLFYGHYDVQPVDPLDLWESPPFEATLRDEAMQHLANALARYVEDRGETMFGKFCARRQAPLEQRARQGGVHTVAPIAPPKAVVVSLSRLDCLGFPPISRAGTAT